MASATSFYDFKPLDSTLTALPLARASHAILSLVTLVLTTPQETGKEVPLSTYKNKVVLVVNTASKCGFTPQYEGLEKLYKSVREKHPDDFVILGFPCNQFGGQEPGTDEEIQQFCQVNYGVTFPIMQKVNVNGDGAAPLFQWLKTEKPGLLGLKMIKWNFEKFLIGKDGKVKGRWASTTKPESLEKTILEELEK
jgi:glutathione peroxidase